MDSVLLRKTLSLIWKLLVFYSAYILLRGHNEPGGGFIGGLLLALGVILRGYTAKSQDFEDRLLSRYPLILGGIFIAFIGVVIFPSILGQEVLTGLWTTIWVPIAGKFSSVLIFDIAVYVTVAISVVYAHRALSISLHRGAS